MVDLRGVHAALFNQNMAHCAVSISTANGHANGPVEFHIVSRDIETTNALQRCVEGMMEKNGIGDEALSPMQWFIEEGSLTFHQIGVSDKTQYPGASTSSPSIVICGTHMFQHLAEMG